MEVRLPRARKSYLTLPSYDALEIRLNYLLSTRCEVNYNISNNKQNILQTLQRKPFNFQFILKFYDVVQIPRRL